MTSPAQSWLGFINKAVMMKIETAFSGPALAHLIHLNIGAY